MRELIGKVWANPAFHAAAARIQRAWLSREFGVSCDDQPSLADVAKVVRASAILACSAESMHREKAYRSEEHTSELQSLMRISYAVFCLKKKKRLIINN